MVTIGARIKKLREIRNYSQDFMAAKLGISQTQYSYLENKQKTISENQIEIIASLLGVTLDYLKDFNPDNILYRNTEPSIGKQDNSFELISVSYQNERNAYLELIANLKETIQQLKAKRKR